MEPKIMDNNLKQLIELQKIDSRLLNIERLRGDLPNIVDDLGIELKTTKEEEKNRKFIYFFVKLRDFRNFSRI